HHCDISRGLTGSFLVFFIQLFNCIFGFYNDLIRLLEIAPDKYKIHLLSSALLLHTWCRNIPLIGERCTRLY
ncbi:uncharacterized protein METZ01_LOCUS206720, partial [marine metagenome]